MSVKRKITAGEGVYFITFTCYKWLPLIETVNGYDIVYRQFDYLKSCGHHIIGYVIMPNHLHVIIAFRNTGKRINTIVSNMKRFMAYEIIERLKRQGNIKLLTELAEGVDPVSKKDGKLHRVFELSFDAKALYTERFIAQKLNYMHMNPLRGKWQLVVNPEDYLHSSARFYLLGEHSIYMVLNYMELSDIDLTV